MGAALDALTAILTERGITSPAGGVAARRRPGRHARPRRAADPKDVVGQVLRRAHPRQCGARRSGHLVLRHGRLTGCRTASPSSANRSGAQSVTRCPPRSARGLAHPDRRTGAADRRRGRAADRAGAGHLLPRRTVPGHRGGQQRRLHRRTGDPRRDGALQRHCRVELDRHSHRARGDQPPGVPGRRTTANSTTRSSPPPSTKTAWC